jgi:type II secretory pathway component PulF
MIYLYYGMAVIVSLPFLLSGYLVLTDRNKADNAIREKRIKFITYPALVSIKAAAVVLIWVPNFYLNLTGFSCLLLLTGFNMYLNFKYGVPLLNIINLLFILVIGITIFVRVQVL